MKSIYVDATASAVVDKPTVRVWDLLIRVFHWTTVLGVLAAFLSEDARDLHKFFGYVVLGALVTRLLWGFIGTRHARFSRFIPWPADLKAYLVAMTHRQERRHLGHNPAGAVMIVALLGCLALITASGVMMTLDAFWGESWVEQVHEAGANLLLGLIALHVAGVVWSSVRHGENLVAAMITGRKRVEDD